MISLRLARKLRAAGLRWRPADGDRFVVPDRGMDDMVFTISTMSVDVRELPGGTIMAFNGVVEWALDSVEEWEVVWLPSEAQLRAMLGDSLRALVRAGDGWRCDVETGDDRWSTSSSEGAEAYGLAMLEITAARTQAELAAVRGRPGRSTT